MDHQRAPTGAGLGLGYREIVRTRKDRVCSRMDQVPKEPKFWWCPFRKASLDLCSPPISAELLPDVGFSAPSSRTIEQTSQRSNSRPFFHTSTFSERSALN